MNYKTYKLLSKEFSKVNSDYVKEEVPNDQYLFRRYLTESMNLMDYSKKEVQSAIKKLIDQRNLFQILEKTQISNLDIANEFIETLIGFVENRPLEDVFLVNSVETEIKMEQDDDAVFITVYYLDDFGNLYELRKKINIDLKEKDIILLEYEWINNPGEWDWLEK